MLIIGLENEGTVDQELDLNKPRHLHDSLVYVFAFHYGCHVLFSVNVVCVITGEEKIMDSQMSSAVSDLDQM